MSMFLTLCNLLGYSVLVLPDITLKKCDKYIYAQLCSIQSKSIPTSNRGETVQLNTHSAPCPMYELLYLSYNPIIVIIVVLFLSVI